LTAPAVVGVAILWGVLAVSRSPSATLGIFAQLRPEGPVSRFSLAFVMSSDLVVVVLMTLALTLVRPLIDPMGAIALSDLVHLGHEVLGSFSLGTTLGLVLAIYLRVLGGQLLIPLLAIGFGPLGALHIGALASVLGASLAVTVSAGSGIVLLAIIVWKATALRRMPSRA